MARDRGEGKGGRSYQNTHHVILPVFAAAIGWTAVVCLNRRSSARSQKI
jgi:hypothetical protein